VLTIDLHCHTTASDGLLSPTELVRVADSSGVDVIAVTDHDTVAGIAEAVEVGRGQGVRVVAGIEFSTRQSDRGTHVLGYFLDPSNEPLVRALVSMRDDRADRARSMVEKLNELGYELSFDEVRAQAGGDVVARPHVARALVARGYISAVRDAFTAELIADGGRAYVGRPEITPFQAIDLIRGAGGVAVVAHPGVRHHAGDTAEASETLIRKLAEHGLAGLEVHHPDHSPLAREHIIELAERYDLIQTGGSDFHGEPGRQLAWCTTPPESLERLEALAR
jgi:3',5'-nucleoside bisphosphate phosphatase